MSRLSERYEDLVEKGARRELERRRLTENYFGEGGIQLSRLEKTQLFQQLALDPTGVGMLDTLNRRREANKLGPNDIPKDWGEWVSSMAAKMLGEQP
jgi:hypothetical protein